MWAVKVQVPAIDSIIEEWRDREERGVRVGDMVGQMVGRMPKHVCNVVHIGMRLHHSVRHASCFLTGEMVQGGPVVGGGPQLRAIYFIEVEPEGTTFRSMADQIHNHIDPDCRMFL